MHTIDCRTFHKRKGAVVWLIPSACSALDLEVRGRGLFRLFGQRLHPVKELLRGCDPAGTCSTRVHALGGMNNTRAHVPHARTQIRQTRVLTATESARERERARVRAPLCAATAHR